MTLVCVLQTTPVHEKKPVVTGSLTSLDVASPIADVSSPGRSTLLSSNPGNASAAVKNLIELDEEYNRRRRLALDSLASYLDENSRLQRKLAAHEKSLKARDQANEALRKEVSMYVVGHESMFRPPCLFGVVIEAHTVSSTG